jgi:hypothetical protein
LSTVEYPVDVGLEDLDRLQDLETAHPGHLEVGDDDVEVRVLQHLDRQVPVGRGLDVKVRIRKDAADPFPNHQLVVDDEHTRFGHRPPLRKPASVGSSARKLRPTKPPSGLVNGPSPTHVILMGGVSSHKMLSRPISRFARGF